ncbi:MAG: hypothetical protein EU541_01740 [Promethearchaeota archaeon]|nr:MAG: hypothetical protein EU541_01740 [Candidatus Lokiarchaeota archaeon]
MKKNQPSNEPDLKQLNRIIDQIKKRGNLAGVVLSYEDGTLITDNLNDKIQKEIVLNNFNPMIASVFKSGEKLSQKVAGRNLVKIVAQLRNYSIIIIKCDDNDLFLALLVDHSSRVGPFFDDFNENIKTFIQEINNYI